MTSILDVVRAHVGRRRKITRAEMRDILTDLAGHGLNMNNGWCGIPQPTNPPASDLAAAWTKMCEGIRVISVLADTDSPRVRYSSSNPGSIRYDDPGSMHPMLRATLMFATADLAEQMGHLRRKAKRVLVVRDDPPTPSADEPDAELISEAREALDNWDPDEAGEGEIAELFAAIYEREPDDDDEFPVDLIFAAPLDAAAAKRVLEVLQGDVVRSCGQLSSVVLATPAPFIKFEST